MLQFSFSLYLFNIGCCFTWTVLQDNYIDLLSLLTNAECILHTMQLLRLPLDSLMWLSDSEIKANCMCLIAFRREIVTFDAFSPCILPFFVSLIAYFYKFFFLVGKYISCAVLNFYFPLSNRQCIITTASSRCVFHP